MSLFLRKVLSSTTSALGLNSLSWTSAPCRVLMYHRVVSPESLSYPIQAGMFVRPETFRMHCTVLKENYNVLSLKELLDLRSEGESPPPRSVAITFDDGWKDNFDRAFPLLKEFSLPATIFLPTSFIGSGNFFWTDLVGIYLSKRKDGLLLQTLEGIIQKTGSDLETLINYLFALPREARLEIAHQLTFVLKDSLLPPRDFLTWEEAQEMEKSGLVSFGNHSHRHLLLGELSATEVHAEVTRASDCLKQRLQSPLSHVVAFPGGSVAELPEGFIGVRNIPSSDSLGRIGVHEDIASTRELFEFRIGFQR